MTKKHNRNLSLSTQKNERTDLKMPKNLQLIDEELTEALKKYPVWQKESELEALINTFIRTENNNLRAVIDEYFPRAVINGKYDPKDSDRVGHCLRFIIKLFEAYGDLKKNHECINMTTLLLRGEKLSGHPITADDKELIDSIASPLLLSEKQFFEMIELPVDAIQTEQNYIYSDDKGRLKVNEFALTNCLKRDFIYDSGIFFSVNGVVDDIEVKQRIYSLVKRIVQNRIDTVVQSVFSNMKHNDDYPELPIDCEKIHVGNGTLTKDDSGQFTVFSPKKEICRNRIATNYYKTAEKPKRFLAYLSELLPSNAIRTIQQFFGVCLIPTNELQKAVCLLGRRGGEGKSVLIAVMNSVFGDKNTENNHLEDLSKDQFSLANLENKLIFFDDDVSEHAIENCSVLKTAITTKNRQQVKRKFVQSHTAQLYTRFFVSGNFVVTGLYDHSDAFRRRLLTIEVNAKKRKEDNPDLDEELKEEKEGILKWLVDGLNDYLQTKKLFVSSDIQKKNDELMTELDSVEKWLTDSDYLIFGENERATTKILYDEYVMYCKENCLAYLTSAKSFSTALAGKSVKFTLIPDSNITMPEIRMNKRARGYRGIGITQTCKQRHISETQTADNEENTKETLSEKRQYI